ncbi:FliH/SctL family protein [Novosphingobium sp. RD2P27]|uniref:Flagellar assembly protein FliH n=1 Tax=Novosphingobium kalidii TaxID=3230299 RepID=A0ABV2D1R0_9SPHN
MTFYLIHRDGKALVSTDRPLLKAREAGPLRDAAALLARADALETQARARRDAAEREARQRGLEQGLEEGRRNFAAAVSDLTGRLESWREAQERQVAALALAALRRMVDDIGDETMMASIARRAVTAVAPGSDAHVQVAPALVDVVSARFAADERTREVPVHGDPSLAEHQCRVTTTDGRIIADLAVQLGEIEKRWSLTHVD